MLDHGAGLVPALERRENRGAHRREEATGAEELEVDYSGEKTIDGWSSCVTRRERVSSVERCRRGG
jgi:hypothetical protein